MVAQLVNDGFPAGCHDLLMIKRPKQRVTETKVTQIHAGKQPRRPHYLAKYMEKYRKERSDLIEDLGVDKSQVSKWLDPHKPSTPGVYWANLLGVYFGDEENPVDIFSDPDFGWWQNVTRGRTQDEVARIKQTVETAFPVKKSANDK